MQKRCHLKQPSHIQLPGYITALMCYQELAGRQNIPFLKASLFLSKDLSVAVAMRKTYWTKSYFFVDYLDQVSKHYYMPYREMSKILPFSWLFYLNKFFKTLLAGSDLKVNKLYSCTDTTFLMKFNNCRFISKKKM